MMNAYWMSLALLLCIVLSFVTSFVAAVWGEWVNAIALFIAGVALSVVATEIVKHE